uniref:Receptor-type tyrosine-protein phosphatase N2 n=1 Tax=Timema cristinae TaxID=61476 RepID=A0A7R9CWB2_TIMCR|nr:unnamed protein product [Timema cristinae]
MGPEGGWGCPNNLKDQLYSRKQPLRRDNTRTQEITPSRLIPSLGHKRKGLRQLSLLGQDGKSWLSDSPLVTNGLRVEIQAINIYLVIRFSWGCPNNLKDQLYSRKKPLRRDNTRTQEITLSRMIPSFGHKRKGLRQLSLLGQDGKSLNPSTLGFASVHCWAMIGLAAAIVVLKDSRCQKEHNHVNLDVEWLGILFVGAPGALTGVAAAALYLIRRHMRSRDKLNNLTAPDTEASKDYQELCRARMATKSQQDKPEPLHVGQRIASLSRESEGSNNSPSSRSSTSSWSEEPALTNMDISTGHMVLSYMEDHLKNKDRLEQEWVGLCAYEAEPCAITLALKPENANKNRYPDILPYDHARLVLNDLTNISGSDYINASTITDHDPRNSAWCGISVSCMLSLLSRRTMTPATRAGETDHDPQNSAWRGSSKSCMLSLLSRRTMTPTTRPGETDHDPRNPAYIATQGALPHTAPDFWQMVWEQGSVVMVMLTRLTENGNAMCHRYWPEEGSELYHIYEVHLVSEHIWCDDYLVRSFYLKNLKTGETRTVTQFHFLSWPDGGVPRSTKALLEFRRKVNKSYRGRSCPIVVHCSDGVGRTGTYCLIDMVLNRMAKGAKEIDIAATLEHIRDQRPQMVKTKQQFEFVLMAVAEEVNAILKSLPPQQQQPSQTPTAQQPQQQPAKQQ